MILDDIDVPGGTTIAMPVYNMNRNPAVFPEPDNFIPERYSAEESAKRNPFSSVSFSAGPRNCIGNYNIHFVNVESYSNFKLNLCIGLRAKIRHVGDEINTIKNYSNV